MSLVPRLHYERPMRRSGGFTIVELMVAVVIVGILAVVAVVAYTRVMRKAKSSEIPHMFGEFKAKEESFHAEYGKYLGACPNPDATLDCVEGDYWPTPLTTNTQMDITGGLIDRWVRLKVSPGKGSLYCQYEVVAGPGGNAGAMGDIGKALYSNTAPPINWFYMLAQCDWDNDPSVNAIYTQRGDLTILGRENEQR